MKEAFMKLVIICGIMAVSLVVGDIAYAQAEDGDYIVAQVGKREVHFSEIEKMSERLNRFLKENFHTSKEWRLNFIRQYIAQIALSKRAEREGLLKDERVIQNLEAAKRNILSNRLVEERLSGVNVTKEDVERHYEENKERYKLPEKIKVSYAKVSSKKKAEKIVASFQKTKKFKKAAGRKIIKLDDFISKDMMMVPDLEGMPVEESEKLFDLEAGNVSQPVEINEKFYVFHVDEKEAAKERSFEEMGKQIQSEVSRKIQDDTINKLIDETFTQEKVKIYEDIIKEKMEQ